MLHRAAARNATIFMGLTRRTGRAAGSRTLPPGVLSPAFRAGCAALVLTILVGVIVRLPLRVAVFVLSLMAFAVPGAHAQSICGPDGVQASGSIYRVCMPPAGYNGILVVWAHGFQDAGTPVSIPEDQLCLNDFCLPQIVNGLGFAFATNSYSKTGLAVVQGKADILDLVNIFTAQHGRPRKVYLIGASEGGLITALNVEQHPKVFSAGVAACGPVGDFPLQIGYFGDARATFEYFFPGLIPGDPFRPDPGLVRMWPDYYQRVVRPFVFDPAKRRKLDQWVAVAKLPFDASNYLASVELSVRDALRYSVVNLNDAAATLGGFPFDNRVRWYSGSDNDILLNIFVKRVSASAAAVTRMRTLYNTSGILKRPLITLHTLRDQQVPYWHEPLYDLKALVSGSLLTRHINLPVDRFGHCNFTRDEALFSLSVMLFYDGLLDQVSGTASFLTPTELAGFERLAQAAGLPNRRTGTALAFKLKD
jgi:pimeloyl-ACP methyl ester carboxylesterase